MANISRATPSPIARPATSGRMSLAAVRKGRITDHPMRVLLYGPEGIGKSTFAAGSPSPIFLCPEDGTAQLDVARLPEPQTWGDVMEAVHILTTQEHGYKTLVVDTLDWIEPLCWSYVCVKMGIQSIEDAGYGKGYTAALDEWRKLIAALDGMRAKRGVHVILLAHSYVKTYKNPEGDDFDRYMLKLHDKTGGLLKEWSDAVLFSAYQTFVEKKNKNDRTAKAFASGARVVHTERRAAWDAKNRYGLPESIPLGWDEYVAAVDNADPTKRSAKLREEIAVVTAALNDDDLAKKVAAEVAKNGDDAGRLAEVLNRLTARLNAKETANV